MAEPISPISVFQGKRDICEYEEKVNRAINEVNHALRERLIDQNPGKEAMVEVRMDDYDQAVILEVVYKFRRAGWSVLYDTQPRVMVGVERGF